MEPSHLYEGTLTPLLSVGASSCFYGIPYRKWPFLGVEIRMFLKMAFLESVLYIWSIGVGGWRSRRWVASPPWLACLRSPIGERSGGKGFLRDGVSSSLGGGIFMLTKQVFHARKRTRNEENGQKWRASRSGRVRNGRPP